MYKYVTLFPFPKSTQKKKNPSDREIFNIITFITFMEVVVWSSKVLCSNDWGFTLQFLDSNPLLVNVGGKKGEKGLVGDQP